MTADWFYLKRGWLRKTRSVGPITETDLLRRIDNGQISPETLLQSESKTRGRWVPMNKIGPAIKHWRASHSATPPQAP